MMTKELMTKEESGKSVHIRLYYDPYTNYFGEGFCPHLESSASIRREIWIEFTLDQNNYWRQSNKNDPCIYTVDQLHGELLLKRLDSESKSFDLASKGIGIKNKYGLVLYPSKICFN
jgi:hypothetical protein